MLDGCHRAFVNFNCDRNTVAGLSNHLRINGRVIATLQDILTLQLELHAFQRRALKDLTNRQPSALQSIEQSFCLNRLVTIDGDLANAGPLCDHDHQHTTIPGDRNIVEIARRK